MEPYRRIARGFRNSDNFRLRMLLIGGELGHPNLKQQGPANGQFESCPFNRRVLR